MSVTTQYLLRMMDEEDNKQDIPGVEPVTDNVGNLDPEKVNPAQVQSPQEQYPLAHQANEEVQRQAKRPDYADEYPLVYDAQQQMKNRPQEVTELQEEGMQEEAPESFLGEEHVEALRTAGFTDEQIASLGQSPDPQSFLNGIATRSYRQTMPEPEPIDEKKMERQRKFAAIGDVLGLFSQAAGAAQGAHVRERKFEEGAMARLSENQQKLYNRYLKQTDNYSRGLVNAQMQDYIQGHKDWRDTEKEMRKALETSRKEKIAEAKQAQRDAIEREKLDNANRKLDAYIKDSDRRLTISEQNARTQAARAEGYNKRAEAWVRKLEDERANPSSGNNIKRHDYEIMIPAHPDDPDAFENDDGELVTIVGTSRAEKDYLIKQAMEDEEFIASLEKSNRALAGAARRGDLSVSQRNLLADYYLQRRYNNQFVASGEGEVDPLVRMGAVGGAVVRQDPVETTIQQVQDAEDEMNPDDEFKIVGTI